MGRLAFVFPGQGSQYVGMAKGAFESSSVFRSFLDEAGGAVGLDLARLALEGPEGEIRRTRILQPLMVAISLGLTKLLAERGITPEAVAGHSLGEYSALSAAGVLDPVDAVRLVAERGRLMEEAVADTKGAMAAILGLSAESTERACASASDAGTVQIANHNCPGQIVISGEEAAVAKAMEEAKALGAKRCIPLPVSGPFHSVLMGSVKEGLGRVLEGYTLSVPKVPIIMNLTADYADDPSETKRLMAEQVAGAVRWEETVARLLNDGVDRVIEVGPGKVLSGLVRKCAGSRAVVGNVEDIGDIDSLSI